MKVVTGLIAFVLSLPVWGQGTLDEYDREATKDEDYGAPSIGKEEMDKWPMHPDEDQKKPKKIRQEELQWQEEKIQKIEGEHIEEDEILE